MSDGNGCGLRRRSERGGRSLGHCKATFLAPSNLTFSRQLLFDHGHLSPYSVPLLHALSQAHLSFILFESCKSKAFKLSYVHGHHHSPPSTRVRVLRLGIRQTDEAVLAVSSRNQGRASSQRHEGLTARMKRQTGDVS